MSQYKSIPQPTDQRNVSQNDILTNYQYLSTPLNPTAGVPNGIIPVDHYASGDNVANPTDGFHKQVSLQDRASPANLVNATNTQTSSGIFYSKADSQPTSQLRYLNSIIDSPVTFLKAAVLFDQTGVILGNPFNVGSVTHTGTGDYLINFTIPLLNVNYLVFGTTPVSGGGNGRIINYGTKNLGNVQILTFNLNTAAASDVLQASVFIIGFN